MDTTILPDKKTKTRRAAPANITTLQLGAFVEVHVRNRTVDAYAGDILQIDLVAVQIRSRGYYQRDLRCWWMDDSIVVIPWRSIEDIEIHQPKPNGARS